MKKKQKKTITTNQSTSDQQVKKNPLDVKKERLHALIDNIKSTDYVEVNSKMIDLAGKATLLHQIFIEKNGNIIVKTKDRLPHFD